MKRITFIGSGNVATNLAMAFFEHDFEIVEICSPTMAHATTLADKVNASATNSIKNLQHSDIYIIATNDDVIGTVAAQLKAASSLVLHTAGSVNIDVLQKFEHYGVIYPLQTFTKDKRADVVRIPFFIEGNTPEVLANIRTLATTLSPYVKQLDSDQRIKLHIAAVFACNFVNYLLGAAADLSAENFASLRPLVDETVEKAFTASHPREVQTGPALRKDTSTMEKHKKILSLHPELKDIYDIISQVISNYV